MIGGRWAGGVGVGGWRARGCAGATFAQAPVVTAEDYARAEKFLSHNAKPLVDHAIESVHWIDDAQFWYRDHDANGDRLLRMDAAHGGVVPAFDHVKLAAALAKASGKEVKAEKLPLDRSEEHTSELQSLMRISYAVFCLQKNRKRTHI